MFSFAFIIFHMQIATFTVTGHETNPVQKYLAIPLTQHLGQVDLHSQTLRAARKHGVHHDISHFAIEAETEDGGFWYGAFDVGESKNLSLLIDTGSADVAVNPSRYEPSAQSQNLHRHGALFYEATQANGCGTANISYNVYTDNVSMAGLESENQTLASVIPMKSSDKGVVTKFPHDGLVGLSKRRANETQLKGKPFFQNLCDQGQVDECRFGLALGAENKGMQILGGVNYDLFDGQLHTTPLYEGTEWYARGNVTVNSRVVLENQYFVLDSGGANVIGPTAAVRSLFGRVGIQAVHQNLRGCTSVLFGYYPCDSPFRIGFQFDPDDQDSDGACDNHNITNPVFDILPTAFKQTDNGHNNCTSIITGIDIPYRVPLWIIGQAWYQGKYVDHDAQRSRIGLAHLHIVK